MSSVFDMIMGADYVESEGFTKEDWAKLGRGDILDDQVVEQMLAEGYENCVD